MGEKKVALLIDAENISHNYIETILHEAEKAGDIAIKNAYGDFSKTTLSHYREKVLEFSIETIHRYSYAKGKNSSDSLLIIDAMDILYSGKVDIFCIASSDSDFTGLAMRLRKGEKEVIGMGSTKAHPSFIKACSRFKYLDSVSETAPAPAVKDADKEKSQAIHQDETSIDAAPSKPTLDQLKGAITNILSKKAGADSWMPLGNLSQELKKQFPFEYKDYQCRTMTQLVEGKLGFEIKKVRNKKNKNLFHVYIRIPS